MSVRSICAAASLLAGLLISSTAHAVIIGPGESITLEFGNLLVADPGAVPCSGEAIAGCIVFDVLTPTGSVQLELFDELTNPPVAVSIQPLFEGLGGIGTGTGPGSGYSIPPDGDGALRITVLSGSIDLLEAMYVETLNNPPTPDRPITDYYASVDTAGPSPVPEPSSLLLLGSGIIGLSGIAWKRRHRQPRRP